MDREIERRNLCGKKAPWGRINRVLSARIDLNTENKADSITA
jgi:hypothetical protein